MCEDAPCCGCCGAAVWAAEARADEEWREARYYDDDYGSGYYDGDDYCKGCGADDLDECTCDDDYEEDEDEE